MYNNQQVIVSQPGVINNEVYGYPPPGYGYPSAPISSGLPQPNTICPPGLEYLIPLDKIFIKQQIERLEIFTGFDCKNRFTILSEQGQLVYALKENTGWLSRACLGSNRNFEIRAIDTAGREAFKLKRPFQWWADTLNVYNGEVLLGSIEKIICACTPEYIIRDEHGALIFTISGPFCLCGFEHEFTIYANNSMEIGIIKKQWSGTLRELFTNADIFGATFPVDLSVKMKAVLIGAVILIDFDYFEHN